MRQGLSLASTRPRRRNHRPVRSRRGSRSNSQMRNKSGVQSTIKIELAVQIQMDLRILIKSVCYSTVRPFNATSTVGDWRSV